MDRDADGVLEEYRKKRLQELQSQISVKEIESEPLLVKKSQKETLCVHFYNKDFEKCREMNAALDLIAKKYPSVEFLRAEAHKFPFVTEKLEIRELPYLASFSKGFFIGGIIGLQDIGETSLDVNLLEQYIRQSDLLEGGRDRGE